MARALEDMVEPFDFTLDRGAEVPIGVQLAWAIRARVEDGRFRPGQRLPGSRDVADTLSVNANTVRAVYGRLELDGVIESRHGSGTFVSARALLDHPPASMIAATAAAEARGAGVEPRDVAAALYVEDRDRAPSAAGESDATRRRELRTQIKTLQQAIDEIETEHVGLIPPVRELHTGAATGPRLLDAEDLERTRGQLLRRLAALQAAIDAIGDEPSPPQGSTRRRTASKPSSGETNAGSQPKASGAPKPTARRHTTRPAAAGA